MFGRVTPQQKRDMVHALQAHGHTVAMTGDGVNDALALKDADIGVAMGSGSDATRSVAQLVLLDSNFDALPPVVAEGRRVLGNIERTSGLYLTKTVYAMLISLAVGRGGVRVPVPAAAPDADRRAHDRHPVVLPGARAQHRAVPAGVRAPRAAVRDPDRHARGDRDVPRLPRSAANSRASPCVEAQTTAVMVLTWIGLLVLSIVAAPLTRPRLVLIWSMAGLFLIALLVAAERRRSSRSTTRR